MKSKLLLVLLLLFPILSYGVSVTDIKPIQIKPPLKYDNSSTLFFSNENNFSLLADDTLRTKESPTQIIRMHTRVEKQQITCDQVHEQINKIVIDKIINNPFIYSIYVNCHYDPSTFLATDFIIHSYFDPLNDEAITFLKSYLSEYNGSNFLGTKLKIEPAKGLIISLNFFAGIKKNPRKPPFIEYKNDRNNFYFKSNYEMKNRLINDIYHSFYSQNPDKIIPFLDKWVFPHAGSVYKSILIDSNYVELQPERIFYMENGEEIFTPELKQSFIHSCEQYNNHRCLRNG